MFQTTTQEKLLILGCGDIGLRLVKELPVHDYSVVGVRRSLIHHDFPHFRLMHLDLYQESVINQVLATEKPDVVLITMTPGERNDEGYRKAYVQICEALIENLRLLNQKPRLILFVSSTSVYAQDDGSWVDESSVTEPQTFSGKRLLEAENLLGNSGFPVCIVRFSGIYGPGRERLINQAKSGKISSSMGFTNRIHADDCARVLVHLIEKQKTQSIDNLYLASDDTPVPMNEIQTWIAEQLGIKNFLSGDVESERSNKKISNQRLKKTGFEFLYSDYRAGYSSLLKQHTGL
jgi:nucleoside-diphosphate-sugar epimerase